tara:strand:- start:116 stop:490 length:375 start_codon:yes stop_codon:yes gene_type:complete
MCESRLKRYCSWCGLIALLLLSTGCGGPSSSTEENVLRGAISGLEIKRTGGGISYENGKYHLMTPSDITLKSYKTTNSYSKKIKGEKFKVREYEATYEFRGEEKRARVSIGWIKRGNKWGYAVL